jgi:hypothetical protein
MLQAGLDRAKVYHQCLDSQSGSKFKKPLYEVVERIRPDVDIKVNPKMEATLER